MPGAPDEGWIRPIRLGFVLCTQRGPGLRPDGSGAGAHQPRLDSAWPPPRFAGAIPPGTFTGAPSLVRRVWAQRYRRCCRPIVPSPARPSRAGGGPYHALEPHPDQSLVPTRSGPV
eukprot:scaffold906_cov395-Prasinococcus_capsulatus_cf.AAC.3